MRPLSNQRHPDEKRRTIDLAVDFHPATDLSVTELSSLFNLLRIRLKYIHRNHSRKSVLPTEDMLEFVSATLTRASFAGCSSIVCFSIEKSAVG